jgi:hypothetical protein
MHTFQTKFDFVVGPTALRLNETYIIYVYFGFRLIVTSIIPFVALAILNSLIYMSVKRRRHVLGKVLTVLRFIDFILINLFYDTANN